VTPQQLQNYLGALHLEDLALANACAEEARRPGSIFSPSTALTCARRRPRFFAAKRVPRMPVISRFPFFGVVRFGRRQRARNGRSSVTSTDGSSLKTWLRAVLAQRHIDSIRAGRRFEELGEDETGDERPKTLLGPRMQPGDPHRERYVASFTRALAGGARTPRTTGKGEAPPLLRRGKTLAEIGRLLGEHESSVSRHWTTCGAI